MKGNDKRKSKAKDKAKVNLGGNKNEFNYFIKEINKKPKKYNKKGIIISVAIIVIVFFIPIIQGLRNSFNDDVVTPYSGFTGKAYFEDIGISTSDAPFKVDKNIDQAYMVELEGICLAETTVEDETMYRFQVEKNGQKSVDMEVSSLMSNVHHIEDSEEAKVIVSKKYFVNNKNEKVAINFYDIYVQKDKIKTFN